MKRWDVAHCREAENEKIDAFLKEIISVSKRHGFSIGHEDNYGGFLVQKFSEDNADWLMHASDDSGMA